MSQITVGSVFSVDVDYPVGTLLIDQDGLAYRLRSYSTNWNSAEYKRDLPEWGVLHIDGAVGLMRSDTKPTGAKVAFIGTGDLPEK